MSSISSKTPVFENYGEALRLFVELKPENPTSDNEVSLEGLSWRDQQGFPKLLVSRLRENKMQFKSENAHTWGFHLPYRDPDEKNLVKRLETQDIYLTPTLPKEIRNCYADVARKLHEKRKESWREDKNLHVRYTSLFEGDCPKFDIQQYDDEDIIIVSEAVKWIGAEQEYDTNNVPSNIPCHLIHHQKGCFYLIGSTLS